MYTSIGNSDYIFLPSGETVQLKAIISINNNISHSFLSNYDVINRSKGYNYYIPDTLDKFILYWNLYIGISISNRIEHVALINTKLSERIVPIETLARYFMLLLL